MPGPIKNLGKLISTHGTSPVYLQRAAIVAGVSFFFFLAMLVAFYVRQHIGYFFLSTVFLIVYVLTLISWIIQRRTLVSIFEDGIRYKKFAASWKEIESAEIVKEGADRKHIKLQKNSREKIAIPSSILGFEQLVGIVKANVNSPS